MHFDISPYVFVPFIGLSERRATLNGHALLVITLDNLLPVPYSCWVGCQLIK